MENTQVPEEKIPSLLIIQPAPYGRDGYIVFYKTPGEGILHRMASREEGQELLAGMPDGSAFEDGLTFFKSGSTAILLKNNDLETVETISKGVRLYHNREMASFSGTFSALSVLIAVATLDIEKIKQTRFGPTPLGSLFGLCSAPVFLRKNSPDDPLEILFNFTDGKVVSSRDNVASEQDLLTIADLLKNQGFQSIRYQVYHPIVGSHSRFANVHTHNTYQPQHLIPAGEGGG